VVTALLSAAALAQDCADRPVLLERARSQLVEVEFDAADAELRAFEVALGCGPIPTPRELARFWLLDGALAFYRGQVDLAAGSLAAARATDPHVFEDSVGAEVRRLWEETEAPAGRGFVNVVPPIPSGAVFVDGRPLEVPVEVGAGFHVVVVGADHATFGRVVTVEDGSPATVEVPPDAIPAEPAEPARPRLLPPPWEPARRGFGLSVGSGVAVGTPLTTTDPDGREFRERAARPTLELEGELRAIGSRWSADVDANVGWLVVGRYLASVGDEALATVVGGATTVGFGGRTGPWTLGLRGGVGFPGRVPLRYFVRRELGKQELEVRLGLNFATERNPEPAAEVRVMLPVLGQQDRGLR
jgi:hypothetical protein